MQSKKKHNNKAMMGKAKLYCAQDWSNEGAIGTNGG
jgi:hypothetical protein